MTKQSSRVEIGVYEKALQWNGSWSDLFWQARRGGFAFVDLSIDETENRAARLQWSAGERQEVLAAATDAGVPIGALCLSVHRKVGPGSANPQTRAHAGQLLREAIDLCADLGVPLLQLAGYFAFYEDPHPKARQWYVDCFREGADYASLRGIQLGLENVDGEDIVSIKTAMSIVEEVGSAWLQLYPDIGNIAEQGNRIAEDLALGQGRMLAIHAKDVRRGEPRRVPMGDGIVDWDEAFTELKRQGWSGRMMIEQWNDDADDSVEQAAGARKFVTERLEAAGINVISAPSMEESEATEQLPESLVHLQKEVLRGNLMLPEAGLVAWTGGNLSALDPETGLVVIKPSGMRYEDMTAEDMVVVDLDGHIVYGNRGPSSDTSSHIGVYRARPDVRSIVHTHSPYATAFAAASRPIPCVLTAIADEFGGDIPLGAYASIGGHDIGEEIVRSIGRSPAIIMKQHGVFAVGPTIDKAVQAAVMVEDVARTVAISEGLGETARLPQEEIEANFDRYSNRYGTDAASEGLSR